jgi:hypothetical protein
VPLQLSAREVALQTPPQARPLKAAFLRKPFFWLILLVVVVFAIAPLATDDIALRERLTLAAIFVTLATSLNMVIGYTRYVNFGHITFFGLGGYIVVYLVSNIGWPLWIACITARILAVEKTRGVERPDFAGRRQPALQKRPQQHCAGNDEYQDERPVPGDESFELEQ